MRVAIGQIEHETNTFSNVKTTVNHFHEWDKGQQIIERHLGVKDFLGGMIDQCNQLGVEIVPAFSAFAQPSGIITKETYEILKNELLKEVYVRLDHYLATVILDNMPPEFLDEFIKMNEEKKPKEEIEQFFKDKVPNYKEVLITYCITNSF